MSNFQLPSRGQEQQRNKILEDLQRKSQLLKQQSIGGQSTPQLAMTSGAAVTPKAELTGSMSSSQMAALNHAHNNSFGYFITQDSSFGNLILPVLPRF